MIPNQKTDEAEPKYRIGPLSADAREQAWVTLVKCGSVLEADLLKARLEGAGLAVFIPDENLMAVEAWALNTFGYVRVQVRPQDYEVASDFLFAEGEAVRKES